jgi:hypothetical protein
MPSFPLPVVFLISGDPVGRQSFLCGAYFDFPSANHVADPPIQPIFRLGIPNLFFASIWLWPEICWVVRAAKTKRNKVVDLVIRVAFLGAVCILSKSDPVMR